MKRLGLYVCVALAAAIVHPLAASAETVRFSEQARPDGGTKGQNGGSKGGGGSGTTAILYNWMHPELQEAWDAGFMGAGTSITVVDDFSSTTLYTRDIGTGTKSQTHGGWTYEQASLVAPEATMRQHDFTNYNTVNLARRKLNILNLSYAMFGTAGYDVNSIGWSARETSIISYAVNDRAVVSKAAGNDGIAMGGITAGGKQDYLSMALIGAPSAIFVGALDGHGTTANPTSLASYSNFAGDDATVQNQFLVVGVDRASLGLAGTSFAAPVVSGYAAILGSKFTNAKPSQIARQLLDTARTDTILNYDVSVHGQGEASISRALAPVAIQ